MIGGHEDLFVGAVGVALGVFLISCAAANWQWYYSLRTARLLQRALGRTGARCFHAILGLGLIALGIAVALGFRWALIGPE